MTFSETHADCEISADASVFDNTELIHKCFASCTGGKIRTARSTIKYCRIPMDLMIVA